MLAYKKMKLKLYKCITDFQKSLRTFDVYIRGLLFKFVYFLYSRSEVFDRVLNVISSENIFYSLYFDV